MLKIVALVEKRADLSWDEFVAYWEREHVKPIRKVPGLRRYTIAPAIKPEEAPYDGIAELYFDSTDDIRAAFPPEVLEEVQADEDEFLASVETFVVAERVQIDHT